MSDITTQTADLLDESRRNELVMFRRHQEHRFDRGIEPRIHARHLELILEIGNRAQAPHDDLSAHFR